MDYTFNNLEKAIFVKRDNRFRAEIEIENERYKAHVPNSGRMTELLVNGAKVWVRKAKTIGRKTPYDLVLVEKGHVKICLNSHLANNLFEVWLKKGKIGEIKNIIDLQREKNFGKSRIDFFVETEQSPYLIEVKSVNLVRDQQSLFPDAPTERGAKHLEELIQYVKAGQRAAVVFVIMREDAESFAPHDSMDPLFGHTLRKAQKAGVEIYGYKSIVNEKGIIFGGKVPVVL